MTWSAPSPARAAGVISESCSYKILIAFAQRILYYLKDEEKMVRQRAAEALRKITGVGLGEDYDKWKQWYESTKAE